MVVAHVRGGAHRRSVALGVTPYVIAIFTLIGMLAVTLQIDWQLSLVALLGPGRLRL